MRRVKAVLLAAAVFSAVGMNAFAVAGASAAANGVTDGTATANRLEWQASPAGVSAGLCVLVVAEAGSESRLAKITDGFSRLGVTVARLSLADAQSVSQKAVEQALAAVRAEGTRRGFSSKRVGILGWRAGADAALRLADGPCPPLFAVALAPTAVPSDWSARACPVCFACGTQDAADPLAPTQSYWGLRRAGVPAEVHAYGDRPADFVVDFDRIREFLNHMGFLGELPPPVRITDLYPDDGTRAEYAKELLWPDGRMPDAVASQCVPYLEWHFPRERKTRAIQIVFSGGGYNGNSPDLWEVAPARRYLNGRGMTVVTLKYRTPGRVDRLPKHMRAWQDLQRTVRLVRRKALSLGLDPDRIGIWGGSAGGHLALLGATGSMRQTYRPVDAADALSCSVQWAVALYSAYILDDGADKAENTTGGNDPSVGIVPDFDFDRMTCPILFQHGDADVVSSMGAVRFWQRLTRQGVSSELHTYARLQHGFFFEGRADTASRSYLDQIWQFMNDRGFCKDSPMPPPPGL